ncbi:MAG: hypothetical protein JWM62_3320 [Frankiales bacterium]|jgi:hypothetical protein|nr:hypothetical protein [Frankiales bacterium]
MRTLPITVVAGAAALTLTGGVAMAATAATWSGPAASGVIRACVTNAGVMRLVNPTAGCLTTEKLLTWNNQGPAGKTTAIIYHGALGDEVAARKKLAADLETEKVARIKGDVDEAARARSAEQKLTNDLAIERDRATAAEGALRTAATEEAVRAALAETALGGRIDGVSSELSAFQKATNTSIESILVQLADEKTARLAGDADLQKKVDAINVTLASLQAQIDSEIARAKGMETKLAADVFAEATRAAAAELLLRSDLAAEVLRATSTETANRAALEDALDTLTESTVASLGELAEDLAFLRVLQGDTQGALTLLTGQVDSLTVSLRSVTGRVTTLEPLVAGHTTKLTSLTTELAALTNRQQDDYTDLTRQINQMLYY